jgi:hypothetical protein
MKRSLRHPRRRLILVKRRRPTGSAACGVRKGRRLEHGRRQFCATLCPSRLPLSLVTVRGTPGARTVVPVGNMRRPCFPEERGE